MSTAVCVARGRRSLRVAAGCVAALAAVAAQAGATALAECREQRRAAPAAALDTCTAAADAATAQGRGADAIEAMFHASEAALALGRFELAETWLARIGTALATGGTAQDRFRLARRTGMLAFRRERYADALTAFRSAQTLAEALGERDRAIVSNDIGIVQRKLGDYPAALASFAASLDLRSRSGQRDELGPVLQNIADVHREAGDLRQSEHYLSRAIELHEAEGAPLKKAHAFESLGLVALGCGDAVAAEQAYARAAAIYADADAAPDRLRVTLRQAALAAEAGDVGALDERLDTARRLSVALGRTETLTYLRLDAERMAHSGRTREAYARLSPRLATETADDPSERQIAMARLAEWAEALGDWPAALRWQRDAFEAQRVLDERQRSQMLDQLRIRYGVAERERELAVLQLQGERQHAALEDARRSRYRQLAVAAAIVLALLALHRRRVWRLRLESERRRAALERELERFRTAAEHLRADRRRLRLALDRIGEPMLLVDAAGLVYLANRAARALLGHVDLEPDHDARPLAEWIGAGQAQRVADWLRGQQEAAADSQTIRLEEGGLWMMPLLLEEELIAIGLSAVSGPSAQVRHVLEDLRETHVQDDAAARATEAEPIREVSAPDSFRGALVALMRAAVDAWESDARRSRLDLAEASGIWRITVDDGRLRVRTMERYLSLERVPERPRWREVLRTAYFVLAECPLDPPRRDRLRALIEAVKAGVP